MCVCCLKYLLDTGIQKKDERPLLSSKKLMTPVLTKADTFKAE